MEMKVKHKDSDYGKTWWNCSYCKLFNSITEKPLNCIACDKAKLDGASPEYEVRK